MKSIFTLMTLFSLSAFAGPTVYTVKGMHCSSCASMVKKSVCQNEEIKKDYGGCTVKITDEKKELGEVTFAAAGDNKVDQEKIQVLLTNTDENYKIVDNKPAAKTK